jgi:Tol biopolymer transport system component
MSELTRHQPLTARRWRLVLTVALLASLTTHHAAAQEAAAKTILVTSLGTPDVAAPDMLPEIFQINVDGSGRKPLLPKKTIAFDPARSPDGKRIVFVGPTAADLRDEKTAWGLFVMNADGSGREQLAQTKKLDEHLLAPSWSPDGKQIAYCTMTFGFRGSGTAYSSPPNIHVIDADGKNLKRLDKLTGLNPVWSADGKRLLFTNPKEGAPTSLCVADADGANVRTVVTPEGRDATIMGDWSPDGKALAYVVIGAGKEHGLFVAQADGSEPRRLAGGPEEIAFGVKWSSDGKRLFFTRRDRSGPPLPKNEKNPEGGRDRGPCAVYGIDVDGRNPRRVTPDKHRDYVGGNFLFAARMLLR